MFIVCLRFSFEYFCVYQPKLRVRSNRMLMHLIVLFSHFYVKIENVLSGDAVAEITEFGEAEILDSLILINVVPGISGVVRSLGHF